jgi:IS30 family transposase
MKLGWSPEQIYVRLKIEHPGNYSMNISHEAIYQHVYSQIFRGGNGRVKKGHVDLRKYLTRRHKRRQTKGFRKAQKLERNAKLPSIEIRPKEADERKIIGHWEGDTIVSKENNVRVKSLNERVSGVVFFGKTKDGTAEACNQVVLDRFKNIPTPFLKSLTQDRGSENYDFKTLEDTLGLFCFFAHSYCSYERGSNENTNGLFRRYFPKGTDFGKITDQEISKVEYLINTRPRKRLGGLTPYEVFYQMTGVALDS